MSFTGFNQKLEEDVSKKLNDWNKTCIILNLVSLACVLFLLSSLTNYLPSLCQRVLGLCLIVISCWCLFRLAAAGFPLADFARLGYNFSTWAGWIHTGWLTDWFWPDTWVQHLPRRIPDLILPCLSSLVLLSRCARALLCCALKIIRRESASGKYISMYVDILFETWPLDIAF